MIPYIEVSHLPSSSSFFSAVLQPLGLQCISPDPVHRDSSELQSWVAYGPDPDSIVLQVRQSEHPLKPPRLSSVLLSAPSKSAVSHLHTCWLRADPPSWSLFRDDRGLELVYDDRRQALKGPFRSNRGGHSSTRVVVYDHDGNRLEVVCPDPPPDRTDPARVLDWRHTFEPPEVGQSPFDSCFRVAHKPTMAPSQYNGHSSHARSPPTATPRPQDPNTPAPEQSTTPRQSSLTGGLNTTTVVGALLGAAAGAALTYGWVSNSSESSPSREMPLRQERESQRRPTVPRRATFHEKPVTSHYNPPLYDDLKKSMHEHSIPRRFADPEFQSFGLRGGHTGGDGDDDVDYGVVPAPPPPRYLIQEPAAKSVARSRASSQSRRVDDLDDSRSRHTARSSRRAPSTRARSETPKERLPMEPSREGGRRSQVPSRRSVVPDSVVSRPPLSRTHMSTIEPDRTSYVSARSHRSRSTTRPPGREPHASEYETAPRGRRAPSQVSAATMRETPREMPIRASSHVSARRIPLPRSAVGSSHAHWDPWEVPLPMSGVGSSHANWDDDMVSLAPSDSISCAGSKRRSRKSRH